MLAPTNLPAFLSWPNIGLLAGTCLAAQLCGILCGVFSWFPCLKCPLKVCFLLVGWVMCWVVSIWEPQQSLCGLPPKPSNKTYLNQTLGPAVKRDASPSHFGTSSITFGISGFTEDGGARKETVQMAHIFLSLVTSAFEALVPVTLQLGANFPAFGMWGLAVSDLLQRTIRCRKLVRTWSPLATIHFL